MDNAGTVARAVAAAHGAGGALRRLDAQTRVTVVARVLDDLRRPERIEQLATGLSHESGLSPAGAAWALRTSLAAADTETLLRLVATDAIPARTPVALHGVVLSSNVPTGCLAPFVLSWLAGVPVVMKVATGTMALATALADAAAKVLDGLGPALQVVRFSREEHAALAPLLDGVDTLSVYGHDRTLDSIRSRIAPTTTFVPHGSGLGLAVVDRTALTHIDDAEDAARRLALDVAAYDQLGCLSPHAALVSAGERIGPEVFAQLLFGALADLSATLPRGVLPLAMGGPQLQWRSVGAVRGTLLEGDGHAV